MKVLHYTEYSAVFISGVFWWFLCAAIDGPSLNGGAVGTPTAPTLCVEQCVPVKRSASCSAVVMDDTHQVSVSAASDLRYTPVSSLSLSIACSTVM